MPASPEGSSRRQFLRRAALGLPVGLAACGFQLREAPSFAFSTVYFNGAGNSLLVQELRRGMASAGVTVLTDPRQLNQAQLVLDVLQDQREKVIAGRNSAGEVREFQLRLRFRFKLRTPEGKELLVPTEVLVQRDISFNETSVLSKEVEEATLYRDMQSDMTQQLMRRLAAIREL